LHGHCLDAQLSAPQLHALHAFPCQTTWHVLHAALPSSERTYENNLFLGVADTIHDFWNGYRGDKEIYENYEGDNILGIDRLVSNGEPKVYVFDASDDFDLGTINQKTGLYFEDYNTLRRINIEGETQSVNKTVVKYVGEGLNQTNTSLSAITKEEYLFGKIFPPEVQNDVFIERGTNSVLDKHLRLSEIRNIGGLEKYGNGFYKINKQ
jgi:hypothetical protein